MKDALVYLVLNTVRRIGRGELIPTIIGALIGGGVGSLLGLAMVPLLPLGIGAGLLVGAAISASIFRRNDNESDEDSNINRSPT